MAEISRYHGVCFRATLTELLEYTLHDVYNRDIKSHDRPPQQGRNPSPHRHADNVKDRRAHLAGWGDDGYSECGGQADSSLT